ncbi:MAG: RpiB/LacA/LacB family sugar-phosphate isomerase [Rikenellaceae bacterium]
MTTIGFAADHAGYQMKETIIGFLLSQGYSIKDYGTNSDASVDYPDYAHALAYGMEKGECTIGVAFCGSANGISMTLNKHQNVRAAICWNTEIAILAKKHNDANICSIPARFVDETTAIKIVEAFLTAEFEGGRHQARVDKIAIK